MNRYNKAIQVFAIILITSSMVAFGTMWADAVVQETHPLFTLVNLSECEYGQHYQSFGAFSYGDCISQDFMMEKLDCSEDEVPYLRDGYWWECR